MFSTTLTRVFGSRNQRLLKRWDKTVAELNALEEGLIALGAEIQKDARGNVIEINLTGQPVGNSDLAQIVLHTRLQRLWLSNTGVTDAGLIELQSMKRLRVLGLARTGITDAGLKHLAAIKSLREVYIFPTKVTDGAVDELKSALPGVRVIY